MKKKGAGVSDLMQLCIGSTLVEKGLELISEEVWEGIALMMEESRLVGIICTYDKPGCPLCFANDTIIQRLGYTREEFEEKFREDTSGLAFAEDCDEIMGSLIKESASVVIRSRWYKKDGSVVWLESRNCKVMLQNSEMAYLSVLSEITEQVTLEQQVREQKNTFDSSMQYVDKLQRSFLPKKTLFRRVFGDSSVLWKPRDMVSGDIYWLKEFEQGMVLCVCDCTGHGIPGALQTVLVNSTLDSIVTEENCTDPAMIMRKLDTSISKALGTDAKAEQGVIQMKAGCEVAIFYISRERKIRFSSSNMSIFICEGDRVYQNNGQKLYIGEGRVRNKREIEVRGFTLLESDAVYIATDGLLDQIGEETGKPFGSLVFQQMIKKLHGKKQQQISNKIWEAFGKHLGNQKCRDDVTLLSFRVK